MTTTYVTKEDSKRSQERKGLVIDKEIERIHQALGHVPMAEELLKTAASKKSPLHKYFEWDDAKAATQHRLDQARNMLRASVYIATITTNGDTRSVAVRKFLLVHKGEPMRLRNEALDNAETRVAIIARATGELRSWMNRWADVDGLQRLCSVIASEIETPKRKIG